MPSSDKRILFVSALDLWGGDAKPLRAPGKTIDFYAENFDNVHILGISENIKKYKNYKNVRSVCVLKFLDYRKSQLLRYFLLNFVSVFLLTGYCLHLCRKHRITHVYGYEVHGTVASYLASRVMRIPLISRFQGTVLKRQNNRLKQLFHYVVYFIHYIAFSLPCEKAVITDDGTFADVVFQRFNSSSYIFLRNGINRPQYPKNVLEINNSTELELPSSYVCCSSRLVRWKKVDRVLLTLKNISEMNIPLVIVGGGPDRERLSNMADELGLNVYFTGHVSQELSYNIIANSLVFLSFYDLSNLGNPVLEAIDSGVPIITINNGNTSSVIQNGINGILLNSWTAGGASTELVRLVTDRSHHQVIANGARKFAGEYFMTWSKRLKSEISFLKL
jgi:L-malate glycosyltransferase